jgi:UDP-glucose 4-epimerase
LRALVTGGAGFIGSRIVGQLLDRRWSVAVIDDLSGGRKEAVPSAVELVVHDVSDPAVSGVIARLRADVVIHAAAQVSVARSMQDPVHDWKVNVEGTRLVLRGATAAAVPRFVFLSSGGAVYGETGGALETDLPAPRSYYAVHKYVAERYVELSGVGYGIARIANAYGPGQRADLEGGVVAIFVDAIQRRTPVVIHGDGGQTRDFVHVDDVARAVCLMAETRQTGLWNVATGVPTSVRDLLGKVEGVMGPAASIEYVARREGDVYSSTMITDRIKSALGWQPEIDLDEGLAALAALEPTR